MVIDQEGRLFNKVNIIDFFAILAVILIIGGVCFKVGSRYIKADIMHIKQKSDTKIEYIKFKAEDVFPEVANQVKLRQRLCDDDKLDAWIVKVKKTPAVYTLWDPESGKMYQKLNPTKKDVVITIKAKILNDDSTPYTKIGNQTANIGSDFELKTTSIDIKGEIIGIKDRW